MAMEKKLEVIRGWPNDGARDNYETFKSGETHSNGDIVIPTSTGLTSVSVTGRGDTTVLGTYGGLVIRGAGDSASATAPGTPGNIGTAGKDTVIWGNALVRVDSSLLNTGFTPAVGDKLTYRGKGATSSTQTGLQLVWDKFAAGDQCVGFVKEVGAAGTGIGSNTSIVAIVF